MHDPTEGGFMGEIGEISSLSGLRAELDYDAVLVHPLQPGGRRAIRSAATYCLGQPSAANLNGRQKKHSANGQK